MVPFKTILTGAVVTPQAGEAFVSSVRKATGTAAGRSGGAGGDTKQLERPLNCQPLDNTLHLMDVQFALWPAAH